VGLLRTLLKDTLPYLLQRLSTWVTVCSRASLAASPTNPQGLAAAQALQTSVKEVCPAIQGTLWRCANGVEEGGGGSGALVGVEAALHLRAASVEWVCFTAAANASLGVESQGVLVEKALGLAKAAAGRYASAVGMSSSSTPLGSGGEPITATTPFLSTRVPLLPALEACKRLVTCLHRGFPGVFTPAAAAASSSSSTSSPPSFTLQPAYVSFLQSYAGLCRRERSFAAAASVSRTLSLYATHCSSSVGKQEGGEGGADGVVSASVVAAEASLSSALDTLQGLGGGGDTHSAGAQEAALLQGLSSSLSSRSASANGGSEGVVSLEGWSTAITSAASAVRGLWLLCKN
jgi:hypothetical protein